MRGRIRFFTCIVLFALSLSVPAMAASQRFSDVAPTYWAYTEIMEAVDREITNGYGDGTFLPTASVTNAHFSAFLARAFYKGEYDDSNSNPWWKPYTDVLRCHGVLTGTTLGSNIMTVYINRAINRYDMAQMMYGVLVDQGAQLPAEAERQAARAAIGDWENVPAGYQEAVATCYAAGVLNGQSDGSFSGQNLMNRAQGCVVVYRLRDYIGKNPGDGNTGDPGDDQTTPPVTTATLANGKPATEENVLAVLDEIKKEYPKNTPWTSANTHYSSAFGMLGSGCAGYALMVSDEIFGLLPARTHTDYDSIKPGDVIEVKNSSGNTIHWTVAITSPDAEGWIQTTGAGSNVDSTVIWGDWYDLSLAKKNGSIVWTRYPQ